MLTGFYSRIMPAFQVDESFHFENIRNNTKGRLARSMAWIAFSMWNTFYLPIVVNGPTRDRTTNVFFIQPGWHYHRIV